MIVLGLIIVTVVWAWPFHCSSCGTSGSCGSWKDSSHSSSHSFGETSGSSGSVSHSSAKGSAVARLRRLQATPEAELADPAVFARVRDELMREEEA